ncbi:MAG: sugar ABC transporter substrate-binding protein [Pusillimonas sp.]
MQFHQRAFSMLIIGSMLMAPLAYAQKIEVWANNRANSESKDVKERAMGHIVDSFKEKNPGVDVAVTVMPWQQLSPSLLRASKSGRVPDVVMLYSPSVPMQIAAGTLASLQPFIDKWPKQDFSDLVRLSQNENRAGDIFALPWQMRVSGLMYREDLLNAVGKRPPQSLDEFAETAKITAKDDVVGIALGFSPEAPSVATGWFLTTLAGTGAKILNEDGTAAFVSPEAERLVAWVADLVNGGTDALPLNVAMQGQEQSFTLFTAKKAVFMPFSSDRLDNIRLRSGLGDAIKMVNYPGFEEGKPAPALVQSWNAAMPKGTKHPEEAWKFIEHASSTDVQTELAKVAGYIPVRQSSLKDPWFQTPEAANISWAVNYSSQHPLKFNFPENTETLYDVWAKMFGQVLTGQMKPEAALAWAEVEYNRRTAR